MMRRETLEREGGKRDGLSVHIGKGEVADGGDS
jgi:hypothetical protein